MSFTARANPSSTDPRIPKYINGPATTVYDKSQLPEGLNADAAGRLRAGADLAVVEGPFDAEALNAVAADRGRDLVAIAAAGTALTAGHLDTVDQVAPLADRDLRIALDIESARRAAAVNVHWLINARQLDALALYLPADSDPADLLAGQRSAALSAVLDRPVPLLDLAVDQVVADRIALSAEGTLQVDQVAALPAAAAVAVHRGDGTTRPVDQLGRQADRLVNKLTELERTTVLNAVVREAVGEEWFDHFADNAYADGTATATYLTPR